LKGFLVNEVAQAVVSRGRKARGYSARAVFTKNRMTTAYRRQMVFGIALLVISLGAIVAGRGYTKTARRMRGFATTRGTVLEKKAVTVPGGDTREGHYGKGGGYMPYVRYAYSVGGADFTNDKVSYAFRGLKQTLAEEQVAAWPDAVDVHYDPANPQEAYLQTHTPSAGRWFIIGGSIGAVLGLLIFVGSAL